MGIDVCDVIHGTSTDQLTIRRFAKCVEKLTKKVGTRRALNPLHTQRLGAAIEVALSPVRK